MDRDGEEQAARPSTTESAGHVRPPVSLRRHSPAAKDRDREGPGRTREQEQGGDALCLGHPGDLVGRADREGGGRVSGCRLRGLHPGAGVEPPPPRRAAGGTRTLGVAGRRVSGPRGRGRPRDWRETSTADLRPVKSETPTSRPAPSPRSAGPSPTAALWSERPGPAPRRGDGCVVRVQTAHVDAGGETRSSAPRHLSEIGACPLSVHEVKDARRSRSPSSMPGASPARDGSRELIHSGRRCRPSGRDAPVAAGTPGTPAHRSLPRRRGRGTRSRQTRRRHHRADGARDPETRGDRGRAPRPRRTPEPRQVVSCVPSPTSRCGRSPTPARPPGPSPPPEVRRSRGSGGTRSRPGGRSRGPRHRR